MSGDNPSGQLPRWGIVATVLASPDDILRFAAYHLEIGAHRLYLYLDEDTSDAYSLLKAHPKIRVTLCGAEYWKGKSGMRPQKHQIRQSRNANDAYARRTEVDWLAHIDVDEFLVSNTSLAAHLATVATTNQTLRIRPMEVLAGDSTAFKAFIPNGPDRVKTVQSLYPRFGAHLRGGFLSHVAGKFFVRTGLPDANLRIHNVFQGDVMNPGQVTQDVITLAHCHAVSCDSWLKHYRYRLEKGAYRADLMSTSERSGTDLFALFSALEAAEGEVGLRAFFDEVCADTPDLRTRLSDKGLLRSVDLGLDATLKRQFPDFAG